MSNLATEVETALSGTGAIAKSDVLRWMRDGDLSTRARVYKLVTSAWLRIIPEPKLHEQCGLVADYLLECIAVNQADELVHGGFEACYAIADWLKCLASVSAATPAISDVESRLQGLYRRGDSALRNRIETGALEHILEDPRLRPFFAHWQNDPVLREAYEPALAWGTAHSAGTDSVQRRQARRRRRARD